MDCRRIASAGRRWPGVLYFQQWAPMVLALAVSLGAEACAQINTDAVHVQQSGDQSKIVLVPNAIDFSSVVLGQKNSQTVKLTNTDIKSAQIRDIKVAGAGLSVTGVTLPLALDPQASDTFNIEFAPKSPGPVSGTLTIESTIASQAFNVKGTGTKAHPKLQTDPTSIDFGKLILKKTTTRKVTVSNTGNSKVTISKVAVSGKGFGVSELPSQFALEPQQTTSFQVSFHPQVKGAVKGSLSFASKDLATPFVLALAGDAVDVGSVTANSGHTVSLEWDASSGRVAGYNVYRGEKSGGPYEKLTKFTTGNTRYSDTEVESGQDYYYVVTLVNRDGHESRHSDQVSVSIPNP